MEEERDKGGQLRAALQEEAIGCGEQKRVKGTKAEAGGGAHVTFAKGGH